KGRDTCSGEVVIIKLDLIKDGPQRFRGQEVSLRHPAIVPILAVGSTETGGYTVKPFLSGGTLALRLKNGPLSIRGSVELVLHLAGAVSYAHGWGVFHFNLKPSKVLFDSAGSAAIVGFGEHSVEDEVIYGTPSYMAPEQVMAKRTRLGPRTDVYGLGAILFEC